MWMNELAIELGLHCGSWRVFQLIDTGFCGRPLQPRYIHLRTRTAAMLPSRSNPCHSGFCAFRDAVALMLGNHTDRCEQVLVEFTCYKAGVASLVYLCTQAPSRMASDLMMCGYEVYEALAVSEVLYLCEHHKIDAVVIAADVEEPDVIEAQMRHICLKLKRHATVKDVIWELEKLFGRTKSAVQ
jgi:hypothetical protein